MNIKFANVTYEDVKEKRKQALANSYSRLALKEETMYYIKRLPFLVVYLLYAHSIIDKCFNPVWKSVFKFLTGRDNEIHDTSILGTAHRVATPFLSFVIAGGVVLIALAFAYKIWFSLVNKIFPRKTPHNRLEIKE